MDVNQNTDCDYYIKKEEDDKYNKYDVFYVIKNMKLNKKIIKEMGKYSIIEFGDKFNEPLCNKLPSKIKEIRFNVFFVGVFFPQPFFYARKFVVNLKFQLVQLLD